MHYNFPPISAPYQLQTYSVAELENLALLCRQEIIRTVARNGGHLASNLGLVELTLALAKVFDFRPGGDRLIFDVGHQSYTWKLITGRADVFHTLRQKNGLSGFPKRSESPYDFYDAGHSSTALSIALGYQRADELDGVARNNIALVGDGALTGGMAFEALNDAGQGQNCLKIILNDNMMSIDKNVGGLAKHLDKLRISKPYLEIKQSIKGKKFSQTVLGTRLQNFLQKIKGKLRVKLHSESIFFENLGFRYYGPVDGHNIPELLAYLEAVKRCDKPVILHVVTQKGYGYIPAENEPSLYHGVAPFEVETGICEAHNTRSLSFSEYVSRYLVELAQADESICAITAAMSKGTGLSNFAEMFPERFFDTGIAEQHAVSLAAGLALGGKKVFVALYSTFSQRAVDQILHDVCLQNLPVTFLIDRAGFVSADGETHQGLYDITLFQSFPHLELYAPADAADLWQIMEYSCQADHPVMIRYPKTQAIPSFSWQTERSLHEPRLLKEGPDYTMLVFGALVSEAERAWQILEKKGKRGTVYSLLTGKNIQIDGIIPVLMRNKRLVLVEESFYGYGMAEHLLLQILQKKALLAYKIIKIKDPLHAQAERQELLKEEGLYAEGLATTIGNWLG